MTVPRGDLFGASEGKYASLRMTLQGKDKYGGSELRSE